MKIKKIVTIELEGETEADIKSAFNIVVDKINMGCDMGGDGNDTKGYNFEVSEDTK